MTYQLTENGGPAFPLHPGTNPDFGDDIGMSLRDWFAGQALAGIVALEGNPDRAAPGAYAYADAMLEARKVTS